MSNFNPKLMTIATLLLLVSVLMPLSISPVEATSTNAIKNPSFESSTDWEARYSSFLGSYAKVQDSQYHRTGSYSGLTKTTNPKQEFCWASLYQSLNVPVQNLSTFSYWIRKGESAPNGYYHAKACIHLSGNYRLYYYHGFDWSSPPSDGTKYKYINVGNPRVNFFIQVSRNSFNDLIDKFGTSILTHNVTGIELFSIGFKNLVTGQKYGQRVNWDDIFMESEPMSLTITLTSSTIDGHIDVGKIVFEGIEYTLPNSTMKPPGVYSITAIKPTIEPNDYKFKKWETGGDVEVAESTCQSTTVTVTGSGTLEAVFTAKLWTFLAYVDGDNDLDQWARNNINDMEMTGSTSEVTVVAMLDRDDTDGIRYEPGIPIPNKYDECYYYIIKDTDPDNINSPVYWSTSEVNMGDPNTLVDFFKWGRRLFSARHYALVLWNHGGGFGGICIDNQPNWYYDPDTLEMPELKWALSKIKNDTGLTVDLLGCDACLMGQTEVVYQVKDFVEVFVGSEEVEYVLGWPYEWLLGNLTVNPLMDAKDLGEQIVTSYKDYAQTYLYNTSVYEHPPTMSAINASEINDLAQSISDLGNWLTQNLETYTEEIDWARENVLEYYGATTDFVDTYHLTQLLSQNISDITLQNLCQLVQENITDVVIAEWHRNDSADSHGLTLFYPDSPNEYSDEYDLLDMSTAYLWDEFLKEYLEL